MNRFKRFTALFLAAMMLFGMVACGISEGDLKDSEGASAPATDAPTEALTGEQTGEATEEPTEALTELPTEEPTDTEAETQSPEPRPMAHVSFDAVAKAGLDITDYLFRPSQTSSEATQDGDTTVLSLTAAKTVNAISSDPYVHFNYEKLAEDMNALTVDTTEYHYLVLRVKGTELWSHTFSVYGYTSTRVQGEGAIGAKMARIQNTEEWQYLAFDLSGTEDPLVAFRFDYINASIAEDTVHISDIYFCKSEEEALAMTGSNTYPIIEQTADDYKLNIMSFNVQTENGTSVRADIRADMLRDLIDEYMPDSIGMQEVTPKWREMMESYVFNDSYTGVGEARTTDASRGLEQSCIFYRSDKYDLLDSGTFWLSDTPDVVGSMVEGANYPRICTYVHLKDKVTGLEYIHMNTHLDHNGDNEAKVGRAIREKQITVMLEKLYNLRADVPVVITGDFNQSAFNSKNEPYAPYQLMTGLKAVTMSDGTEYTFTNLADCRMHALDNMPEGMTATMTKYYDEADGSYNPAKAPIDYVFYSNDKLEALSYAIRLYDKGGMYLSDHLPVITSFKVIPAVAK